LKFTTEKVELKPCLSTIPLNRKNKKQAILLVFGRLGIGVGKPAATYFWGGFCNG